MFSAFLTWGNACVDLTSSGTDTDRGSLIGYHAVDRDKEFDAIVTDFIDQNQNRILVLDFNGSEVMVPLSDEVILSIDHSEQIIDLNLPEGLIHLND